MIFWTPLICAQDLSKYRDYQLGMTLAAVAKHVGMKPSDARVLHERPDVVEELEWRVHVMPGVAAPDSVRRILFSFYRGLLFRVAVNYDWDRTEGLTTEDMIEAISATYGLATLPATNPVEAVSPMATSGDRAVAHWEDAQYSLDLYRPSHASTFALTLFSKQSDALARIAGVEASLIQVQEAPARAIERRRAQEAERHVREENARRVNKAAFRP
jgi:hypothetical protein